MKPPTRRHREIAHLLASYCSPPGGATVWTIARNLRLAESTVQQLVNDLVRNGVVKHSRDENAGEMQRRAALASAYERSTMKPMRAYAIIPKAERVPLTDAVK